MPRRTHEDSLETKNNILASAQRLFSRRGFERTSLSDIAKYAGVTRGAIYWHFENKEELLVSMLEHLENEKFSIELLHDACDPNQRDPLSKLKSWLNTTVLDENTKFINSALMSLIISIMNGSAGNEEAKEKLLGLAKMRHEQIALALKNCISKGQLPQNMVVNAAVEHLGVFLIGYCHQSRFNLADSIAKQFELFVDFEFETIKRITADKM